MTTVIKRGLRISADRRSCVRRGMSAALWRFTFNDMILHSRVFQEAEQSRSDTRQKESSSLGKLGNAEAHLNIFEYSQLP